MGVLNNIFRGAKKYPVLTGIVIFICIVLMATIIFIGVAILIWMIFILFLVRKGKITTVDKHEIKTILTKIKETIGTKNDDGKILLNLIKLLKYVYKLYSYRNNTYILMNNDLKKADAVTHMKSDIGDTKKDFYSFLSNEIVKDIFNDFTEILIKINTTGKGDKKYKASVDMLITIKSLIYSGNKWDMPGDDLAKQFRNYYLKNNNLPRVKLIDRYNSIDL